MLHATDIRQSPCTIGRQIPNKLIARHSSQSLDGNSIARLPYYRSVMPSLSGSHQPARCSGPVSLRPPSDRYGRDMTMEWTLSVSAAAAAGSVRRRPHCRLRELCAVRWRVIVEMPLSGLSEPPRTTETCRIRGQKLVGPTRVVGSGRLINWKNEPPRQRRAAHKEAPELI